MTTDEVRVLELYRRCRVADQLRYYDERRSEFGTAVSQLGIVSAVMLALGATSAALSGTAVAGAEVWAVLAAVFPAIATAVAGFGSLYAFEQQKKIYSDAAKVLRRIDRRPPDLGDAEDPAAALHAFVLASEDVFRREQGQWGQLVSDIEAPKDGG